MNIKAFRTKPEWIIATSLSALAVLALTTMWSQWATHLTLALQVRDVVVALCLTAGVIVASKFPIHIRYHTKASMTSVPLYLLAVLVSPPLAISAAGAGILVAELLMRRQLGSLFVDIVTSTARWILIVFAGTLIAHWPWLTDTFSGLTLLAAAIAMFVGDLATVSLQISQMCGENPWQVLKANVREAGITEGVQYLIGMLGALAALREIWALLLLVLPTIIAYRSFKNVKEMHTSTRETLEALADAVDLRDPYTGGHSRRVADWVDRILKEMNIFGTEADLIIRTAHVHDIGKIGIPDEILRKPGPLTPTERTAMESHSEQGAALLAQYPDFARGADIIRHHHERWDGQGYPRGLTGHEIPFGARVIAVADSVDAMTSDRPYRKARTLEQASEILTADCGTQWDPAVVDAWLRCIAAEVRPVTHTAPIGLPTLSADLIENRVYHQCTNEV